MISQFKDEYACFSNFYIETDGTHVEGEFQAAKATTLADKHMVLYSDSAHTIWRKPRDTKKVGRAIKLRSDWEQVKYQRMYGLVYTKFLDWADLGETLLSTGNQQLIEGNNWNDTEWGMVMNSAGHLVAGENHLGRILMRVREELRQV